MNSICFCVWNLTPKIFSDNKISEGALQVVTNLTLKSSYSSLDPSSTRNKWRSYSLFKSWRNRSTHSMNLCINSRQVNCASWRRNALQNSWFWTFAELTKQKCYRQRSRFKLWKMSMSEASTTSSKSVSESLTQTINRLLFYIPYLF